MTLILAFRDSNYFLLDPATKQFSGWKNSIEATFNGFASNSYSDSSNEYHDFPSAIECFTTLGYTILATPTTSDYEEFKLLHPELLI